MTNANTSLAIKASVLPTYDWSNGSVSTPATLATAVNKLSLAPQHECNVR